MVMDNTVKSIWNMDEARLKSLNGYLLSCEFSLHHWDFENIHKYISDIKRVVFPMFKDTERDKLSIELEKLENLKRKLDNSSKDKEFQINSTAYHHQADEIYLQFGILIVQHGLIFRKGDDAQFAALRR